ncbi:MAG: hypothetical protein ACYCX2_04715 [Christensenellales bacterium]
MSNCVEDFTSQVHDNMIRSYSVDFMRKELKLNTAWEDKENTLIEFTGLLAHKFQNVISSNIIFGLYQTPVASFVEEEKGNLAESMQYGFPVPKAMTVQELSEELENERYKVFCFESSIGLFGYVIAKDMKIVINKAE